MTVNVDDGTLPLDNALSSPASEGAGEFRALKTKVNSLFLNAGIAATYAGLIDTNGKGINVAISDGSNITLLSSRFKVIRTASQVQDTLGMYSEAVLNNGVSTPGKILSALYSITTAGTGSIVGAIYCLNSLVVQQNHAQTAQAIGFYLVFANRLSVGAAAPGGLGSNQYNRASVGLFIDAYPRSSSGEFCGWKTGIKFGPSSMDADNVGKGYGIDFASLSVASGGLTADPRTSYFAKGMIRMTSMQSIVWDANEDVMTYFDNATNRWTLRYQNTLVFAIDVTTGTGYKNGVLVF